MPTFETAQPIAVTVDLSVGDVRITASDRTDTVVDVRPSDPNDESDVQAAQRVTVDHANGQLRVIGPKSPKFDFSRKTRSVQVTIELPTGSSVTAETEVGDLTTAGRLGDVEFKTSAGHAEVEQVGGLRLRTSIGHLAADEVAGDAEIHTSSGKVRVGVVAGSLEVKNSNGDTEIGQAIGAVLARSSNGSITLGEAGVSVDAKSANGNIRVGKVTRGSVTLSASAGDLEIGVAAGTIARLDVKTGFGKVRQELSGATRPEASDDAVEVHARTSFGDITITRA